MKYFEARTKGDAIVARISKQLREYGYTDVIFRKYPFQLESGRYRLSNSIHIYFWNASYGYMLSISDKNEKYKPNELCDFDNFIATCEKIIHFAKNTSVLEGDYVQAFDEYLKQQGILDAKSSRQRIDETYTNVCFYNTQYRIYLHRMNVNTTLNPKATEPDNDYDEELPEKPDEEIYGYLKSEIDRSMAECRLGNGYRYETVFEWDCIVLNIYNQTHMYNLFIKPSLGYDELGYQIKAIVDSFIRQIKNKTTNLLAEIDPHSIYNFHKHSQNDDSFSAIVCEELDVFEIVAWVENRIDNGINKTSLLSPKPTFDRMNGSDFEAFCAKLLRHNGFDNVALTQSSGDQGVDIIAYKDSIKYGIQCKCYSADVGNKAVQEVVAGKIYYDCDVGVVLTNSHFTKAAVALAQKSRIRLWDREKLIQMAEVMEYM